MGNQTPDDLADFASNGSPKAKGSSGLRIPFWTWLLLVICFAVIFWQLAPRQEKQVVYNPWFLDQVDQDNIATLVLQGSEAHGTLRRETAYIAPGAMSFSRVKKFSTYIPSESDVDGLTAKLRGLKRPVSVSPPVIEAQPPHAAIGIVWITLLAPGCIIVGLIYLMMRSVHRH